jgi:hypothetical protein
MFETLKLSYLLNLYEVFVLLGVTFYYHTYIAYSEFRVADKVL